MGPINYGAPLPQVDIGQELLQGLQLGGALRQQRTQQEQQAAAQERAKQYGADVEAALKTPTHHAFAALTAKYPEQRDAFKLSWDQLSEGQKSAEFGLASKAFAALSYGNTDIATQLYERQIAAKEASGADASEEKMVLDAIKRDPVKAKGFIGYGMFSADPDKYAESVAKLGGELRAQEQATAALQEAQGKAAKTAAEAKTAEVTARYADSQAVADLTKKGWDITKIEQDIRIAKETNRIKAMEVAAAKEGNALKREDLQLKIEETKRARDEKIRENVDAAESGAATIDNMLNTIQKLQKAPGLRDVVGSIEGSLLYPNTLAGVANTLNPFTSSADERAEAIALFDTLGAETFLAQVKQDRTSVV
jgi:hypothetical protein